MNFYLKTQKIGQILDDNFLTFWNFQKNAWIHYNKFFFFARVDILAKILKFFLKEYWLNSSYFFRDFRNVFSNYIFWLY